MMPPENDEHEITREGPQSYLERAVASVEGLGADASEDDERPPKAEPGNSQEPVAGQIEDKPAAKGEPQKEAAPAEGDAPDPLADLERKIAERAARRQEQSQPSEVDQLKQQLAAMEAKLNERRTDDEVTTIAKLAREGRWAELAEAAGHDPLGAFDQFTRQATDRGKEAAERRIAALEAKLEQREREAAERSEKEQREAQERQTMEVQRRAVQGWIAYAEQVADKFPHVAALDPSDLAREGVFFATQLAELGEQVTYEAVAPLVEAKYKRLAARLGAKGTNGATRSADAGDPKTITNDLAAQSSGPDDRVKRRDEYLSQAVKSIERIRQGA